MEEITPNHKLTKKTLSFVLGVIIICIFLWIFLVPTQWNEGFYIDNPTVLAIAGALTQLGSEYAIIMIFIVVFLGIDKKFATRLMINYGLVNIFGNFFKLWFQDPRPAGNIVDGEAVEESYGFPSGHTYGTVAIWGFFAFNAEDFPKKQTLVKILAAMMMIVIPLTRLILGVHDLQDVLGGYVIGFTLVTLYMFLEPILKEKNWKLGVKIGLGVLGSLILWGVLSVILFLLHPEELLHQIETMAQGAGMLIGFSIALPLEATYVQYDPKRLTGKQKILGTLLGLILTLGLFFGLSFALKPLPAQYIFRAVRYGTLAIVATLGAPWLLNKIFKQ